MDINNDHIVSDKIQKILIFALIIWFYYSITLYISPYTVDIGVKLLKMLSKLLSPKTNQIISITLANIDQYIAILITGIISGFLILRNKKSIFVSFIIFIFYVFPQILIYLINIRYIYGNKYCFLIGKIIVLLLIYLFALIGVLMAKYISKAGINRH